jgi:hypothetical protein
MNTSHTSITAAYILTLATQQDGPDPASILGTDSWKMIQDITLEDVIRGDHSRGHSRGGGYGNERTVGGRGVHPRGHSKGGVHDGTSRAIIRTNMSGKKPTNQWKKPSVKPKPTSFDEAMKQKIVGDLNKITPANYDTILKSLRGICSRLSDDEHPWALRLILENATRQHVFATTYVQLYKDIAADRKKDIKIANEILKEFIDSHREKILTSVDNGENYDEFCAANKMKTQLAGHSIVLAEAANMGIIPLDSLGPHASGLVDVLGKVILSADDKDKAIPKETTENSIKCIIDFFTTLAKTKASKEGFQHCIRCIGSLLDTEKKEKHLSPKARFALMDFVDGMKKIITEIDRSRKVYRPGMFNQAPSPRA